MSAHGTSSNTAPWLIYALGNGWGHLNRALALARVAPVPAHILVSSPHVEMVRIRLQGSPIHLHALPAGIAVPEVASYVREWVNAYPTAACLLVDTFPRGLVGDLVEILPDLSMPCFWIHRDLNPRYIAAKDVAAFVREHYVRILVPGEIAAPLRHLPNVCFTPPWVQPLDKLSGISRQQFQLPVDRPMLMVCVPGNDRDLAFFGEITQVLIRQFPNCTVRCLAHRRPPQCQPVKWISHWPGIEVLQFASIAIGAAGYNTVYECKALGIPLVSFPCQRTYDRQAERAAANCFAVKTIEDCVATVERLLHCLSSSSKTGQAPNGIHIAINQIVKRLSSKRY